MNLSWKRELPMWLVLAGMFALAAITWPGAPERIPVHWNLHQQVDRYGGRVEGLLGMPLLAAVLYAIMLFIPRIDPGRANYEAFAGAYATFRLALVSFLAAVYGIIHLWIRGVEVNLNTAMPLLMGTLFILVGNLLGKLRPNWFLGIRTPWTLSSKVAWVRAHRAGGWVFIATGLLFMGAGVVRTGWMLWTATLALAAGIIAVTVYSFFVWRADPDKVPPAGTTPA